MLLAELREAGLASGPAPMRVAQAPGGQTGHQQLMVPTDDLEDFFAPKAPVFTPGAQAPAPAYFPGGFAGAPGLGMGGGLNLGMGGIGPGMGSVVNSITGAAGSGGSIFGLGGGIGAFGNGVGGGPGTFGVPPLLGGMGDPRLGGAPAPTAPSAATGGIAPFPRPPIHNLAHMQRGARRPAHSPRRRPIGQLRRPSTRSA